MLPSACRTVLQTLEALSNVCSAALERQLGGGVEKPFQMFTSCYTALCTEMRVSVTPKTHILSTHILEYVREINKSLFWTSESALERQHTTLQSEIIPQQHRVNLSKSSRNLTAFLLFIEEITTVVFEMISVALRKNENFTEFILSGLWSSKLPSIR